jgi:hypothetical protein
MEIRPVRGTVRLRAEPVSVHAWLARWAERLAFALVVPPAVWLGVTIAERLRT